MLQSEDCSYIDLDEDMIKLCKAFDSLVDDSEHSHIPICVPHSDQEVFLLAEHFLKEYLAAPMDPIPTPIPWPQRIPDVVTPHQFSDLILSCSHDTLFRLLHMANYLHVEPLLELCSARLGRLLINRTPAEIQEFVSKTSLPNKLAIEAKPFTNDEVQSLLDNVRWSVAAEHTGVEDEAEPLQMLNVARHRWRERHPNPK